jgi:hypothetical protein
LPASWQHSRGRDLGTAQPFWSPVSIPTDESPDAGRRCDIFPGDTAITLTWRQSHPDSSPESPKRPPTWADVDLAHLSEVKSWKDSGGFLASESRTRLARVCAPLPLRRGIPTRGGRRGVTAASRISQDWPGTYLGL